MGSTCPFFFLFFQLSLSLPASVQVARDRARVPSEVPLPCRRSWCPLLTVSTTRISPQLHLHLSLKSNIKHRCRGLNYLIPHVLNICMQVDLSRKHVKGSIIIHIKQTNRRQQMCNHAKTHSRRSIDLHDRMGGPHDMRGGRRPPV